MRLATRLAKALTSGRSLRWRPETREEVLARLLVKRAEAQAAGLDGLEGQLRQQIRWALPMRKLGEAAMSGIDEPNPVHDRL